MSRKFGSAPNQLNVSGVDVRNWGGVAVSSAQNSTLDIAGSPAGPVGLSFGYLWNPSVPQWERARVGAIVVKSVTAFLQGATAVWTPAAGKRFRLFAAQIILPGNASIAVAAVLNIGLQDQGAFGLPDVDVFVPAAAGATPNLYAGPWLTFGPNGYLSAAANNVLNVNLGVALATGAVRVNAVGVEE